jgi:uncharacterized protein YndB with AHSA1/START domain
LIEIEHTAHSTAPRAAVWALLADLRGWHRWGPWTRTDLDGDPANPVGATRDMHSDRKRILARRPYHLRERVTAFEPEERLEYDLLSGLPVRNYHAAVTLSDAEDGGTDIHWRAQFDPPWPVFRGLWRDAMTGVISQVSEALAAEAAAQIGRRSSTA